jgi:hypothetical protein
LDSIAEDMYNTAFHRSLVYYYLFSCGIILTYQQQVSNQARTFKSYAQGVLTNPAKSILAHSASICAALCTTSIICSGYGVEELGDGHVKCSIAAEDLTWTDSSPAAAIYTGIYRYIQVYLHRYMWVTAHITEIGGIQINSVIQKVSGMYNGFTQIFEKVREFELL